MSMSSPRSSGMTFSRLTLRPSIVACLFARSGWANVPARPPRRCLPPPRRPAERPMARTTARIAAVGVDAGAPGGGRQASRVVGEAGAAVAGAGMQELAADPPIHAHSLGHGLDVGAQLLAQVRDLVDEG